MNAIHFAWWILVFAYVGAAGYMLVSVGHTPRPFSSRRAAIGFAVTFFEMILLVVIGLPGAILPSMAWGMIMLADIATLMADVKIIGKPRETITKSAAQASVFLAVLFIAGLVLILPPSL